jgi:hypothetical protein
MREGLSRCGGFVARPMPGIRPGGRHTSLGAQRSRQENRPEKAALRVPCAARPKRPAKNSLRSLRSLWSNSCAESVVEARCARASPGCAARRLLRGSFETANSPIQQPAKAGCWVFGIGYLGAPLLNRREAQKPRARAKRASRTDSRRLSERSERSERSEFGAALGFEHRREARRAGFAGAISLPTFLFAQESRSAAGTKSRLGLGANPLQRMANQMNRTSSSPIASKAIACPNGIDVNGMSLYSCSVLNTGVPKLTCVNSPASLMCLRTASAAFTPKAS